VAEAASRSAATPAAAVTVACAPGSAAAAAAMAGSSAALGVQPLARGGRVGGDRRLARPVAIDHRPHRVELSAPSRDRRRFDREGGVGIAQRRQRRLGAIGGVAQVPQPSASRRVRRRGGGDTLPCPGDFGFGRVEGCRRRRERGPRGGPLREQLPSLRVVERRAQRAVALGRSRRAP